MTIEAQITALAAEVAALRSHNAAALARIESRLPPTLGDRAAVRGLLKISDATISRRIRDGGIRSIRVGGRRMFDLTQFEPDGQSNGAEGG